MYKFLNIIFLFILIGSCDKQSNPFIGDNPVFKIENMKGESRDILIIEDFSIDCSLLNESDCTLNEWCNFSNSSCASITKDLLVIANQYEEGLVIYEIDDNGGLEFTEIYYNNSFEVLDDVSLENDLELRKLIYSNDTKFLYVLDKFEYVYSAWMPGLVDQNSCLGIELNPYQLNAYDGVSNYHTTQAIIDESDIDNLDEVLLLFKYNENNISEQNLEGLASSTTSSSKFGTSYLNSVDIDLFDAECNSELVSGLSSFNPYSSPIFDYDITNVYFDDGKIYIANPYDDFIIKNSNGNKLNIDYYDIPSNEVSDGCNLPNNSITFLNSGELLYNINSEINYFEFNFYGEDLMDLYEDDCTPGPNNYFIKCLTGTMENQIFTGDVNNQSFEIMISGNKLIGNLSVNSINTENNCGTLLSLDKLNNNTNIFRDDFHSISIYDFVDNGIIEFIDDFKTNSKVKSVYVHDNYIVTGMIDDGCYITLLEQGSHNINDLPILGSSNFTINNIYYDEDKELLILSCGSNGVLIYSWDGISGNVSFLNHIVSSHAYSAKVYKDSYIIVATKYGVEIYNYEINQ